eukprot:TRINITY_DN2033_c0_g1_i1.p1 TRINITY_DN2033_c0_g1~~TRINITY_DN2033_c0_g1_i1.p1  ORF type:complete len:199 (+),score=34.04 TRINITY_DN2033_c0_g1_i1:28-624(+)
MKCFAILALCVAYVSAGYTVAAPGFQIQIGGALRPAAIIGGPAVVGQPLVPGLGQHQAQLAAHAAQENAQRAVTANQAALAPALIPAGIAAPALAAPVLAAPVSQPLVPGLGQHQAGLAVHAAQENAQRAITAKQAALAPALGLSVAKVIAAPALAAPVYAAPINALSHSQALQVHAAQVAHQKSQTAAFAANYGLLH